MKKFSLIVPTIGRKEEIERLLDSISNLNYNLRQIEVVIVDQNTDDLLIDIVNKFRDKFYIKHLKVDFRGAARARNYGFMFSKGKYVHFPDDDSFYHPDTLYLVEKIFEKGEMDAISVQVLDPIKKSKALLNFPDKEQYVNCKNFFKTTIEFNTFFMRDVFSKVGLFDERFGVGSIYPSEESGDLILRSLKKKIKIFYTPKIIIYHEDKRSNIDLKKNHDYAVGFGALLVKHLQRKNLCIIPYAISYIGKALIGFIVLSIVLKKERLKYKYRLKGVLYGIKKAKGRI